MHLLWLPGRSKLMIISPSCCCRIDRYDPVLNIVNFLSTCNFVNSWANDWVYWCHSVIAISFWDFLAPYKPHLLFNEPIKPGAVGRQLSLVHLDSVRRKGFVGLPKAILPRSPFRITRILSLLLAVVWFPLTIGHDSGQETDVIWAFRLYISILHRTISVISHSFTDTATATITATATATVRATVSDACRVAWRFIQIFPNLLLL